MTDAGRTPAIVRVYQAALRLYPASFRKYYGAVMLEAVVERHAQVIGQGLWAKIRFYLWVTADLCFSLIREHVTSALHGLRNSRSHWSSIALLTDVRYALRSMRRSPGFTLVALVTLALGIGASVAMFSTAHNALVSSLPFTDAGRLVAGRATFEGNLNPWAAGADYYDYRDGADAFESLGTIMPFAQNHAVTGGDEPERVSGAAVSTNLFATLGVNPIVGRHFAAEEGLADAPDVVLISYGYWRRRFGQDPDVLGSTLTIDAQPYTVIGVMPQGFRFMPDADFWRAMRPDRDLSSDRRYHNWYLVGRLVPDVSIEQAQTQVDVISAQLAASYPETNETKGLQLDPLHSVLVADYRTRLYLLTAAVALVLLIACANVTGILLARAPVRRMELSVRAALGASRSRLVLQLLAENMVLAIVAAAAGTVVAVWMQQIILEYMQMDLPGMAGGISGPMLLYSVLFAGATGLLVGIYPALSSAHANLAADLKAGSRRVAGGGTTFRAGLVIAQVAVSVMLLVGSALLIQSVTRERAVNPGFDYRNMLTVELQLPASKYGDQSDRTQFFSALLENVRAIPGVRSATLINNLPIRSPRNTYYVYTPADPEGSTTAFMRTTVPGYFETMGIQLLAGRGIEAHDDAGSTPVTVINQRAAERFFPDGDAVGGQLAIDFFGDERVMDVVGVVGDVRMTALNTEPSRPAVYAPYPQAAFRTMQLAVRTDLDPMSVVQPLRGAVWNVDRDIPLGGVATMQSLIADSMSERRTIAMSLTLYAALPLLLAAVGLYALLAYHVSQRNHELGVRLALGADPNELGRSVLRQGVALVAIGLVVGLAGALGFTRLIQQLLFGVEATDAATYAGVSVFVLAIALVACAVPAWRAVRTDPLAVLQAD